jgi:hypothetical protein
MNRCAIASREHCRPQPKVKIFYERKSKKKEQKSKRRVPVTASIAWPTSIREMDERSKIRWQHRLKREHPTCTERRSLLEECGWKGGDSGLLGERENLCPTKKQKNSLDSDRPSHGRRFRSEPVAIRVKPWGFESPLSHQNLVFVDGPVHQSATTSPITNASFPR